MKNVSKSPEKKTNGNQVADENKGPKNQIMLDDYMSINESREKDEYGLEDGMLECFPDREKASVVKYDGETFIKKDALQDFINRGIVYKVNDPCCNRLTTRRPKMLIDAPLFGYTVDFNHYNKLINDHVIENYQADGALSLFHYDSECEIAEEELTEQIGGENPAYMQRYVRELKLSSPQSIEKLEHLGILVPIEEAGNLTEYHKKHDVKK